jgi:hypothetical protein
MGTSVLSQKFTGIRPALHPSSRRCSSLKYLRVFAVVAPCDRGASTLSVLSEFLTQDTGKRSVAALGCSRL